MDRRIHIIIAINLFLIGGFIYLIFEMFAPFCAKHVCGSSSGGFWSLLPNLSIIFILLGVIVFIANVILYENPKEE